MTTKSKFYVSILWIMKKNFLVKTSTNLYILIVWRHQLCVVRRAGVWWLAWWGWGPPLSSLSSSSSLHTPAVPTDHNIEMWPAWGKQIDEHILYCGTPHNRNILSSLWAQGKSIWPKAGRENIFFKNISIFHYRPVLCKIRCINSLSSSITQWFSDGKSIIKMFQRVNFAWGA